MPNTFRPRGAPTAEPNAYVDSYNDWNLVHRGAMAPWGVYEKDGQTSAGFAWPSMITEPIEAGKRFLSPGGGFENLPNEQSTQDATTLLLSMYGGNALSGTARAGATAMGNALSDPARVGLRDYGTAAYKSLMHHNEPAVMGSIPREFLPTVNYSVNHPKSPWSKEHGAWASLPLRDSDLKLLPPSNEASGALTPAESGYFNALMQTRTPERPSFSVVDGGQSIRGKSEPFFQNGFVPDDGASVTATQAYEHYVGWAERHGLQPLDLPEFSRAMADAGYNKQRLAGRVRYTGIDTNDELFSDTGKPSLLGSALAGAQGERNGISWTQKLFDEAAAHPSAVKTNDGFVFTETPIGFKINSPYGEVGGQVYPERNTLQIGHISAEPEGQGHGTRLMQNLARYAADKGLKLVSDNSVSSKQQNVYNALMRRGYQIKENAVSGFGRIPRYEFDMESIPSVSQASQGERNWWE